MDGYFVDVIGSDVSDLTPKGSIVTKLSHQVSLDVLQTNLTDFIEKMCIALKNVQTKISNYSLHEIEMSVDISASGGVTLVGSIEAGAKGGITLKFVRDSHE